MHCFLHTNLKTEETVETLDIIMERLKKKLLNFLPEAKYPLEELNFSLNFRRVSCESDTLKGQYFISYSTIPTHTPSPTSAPCCH